MSKDGSNQADNPARIIQQGRRVRLPCWLFRTENLGSQVIVLNLDAKFRCAIFEFGLGWILSVYRLLAA